MNLRPPSVTVSTHTSAFKAVAFQSPAMPNARMSLWTQSVHSFSFPPRPLRTAPSRFPSMVRWYYSIDIIINSTILLQCITTVVIMLGYDWWLCMVINIISIQWNGGFLPDTILLTQRLLPLGNPVKYHVVALYS